MNKLAIGILSLSRPDYLRRCLESFEKCADVDKADFYLLQDGAVNYHSKKRYTDNSKIAASMGIFRESSLPNKQVIRHKWNIGPAGNLMALYFSLFDKGHEYVTAVANDMNVGKFYIKTLNTIYRQFENDEKAGLLRTGPAEAPFRGGKIHTEQEARSLEDKVAYGFAVEQDLGIWRWCFERIKAEMQFYRRNVTKCDWRQVVDYAYGKGTDWDNPHVNAVKSRFGYLFEDHIPRIAAQRIGCKGLHALTPRITGFGATSVLRQGYEQAWRSYKMEAIPLWDIGDVDEYSLVLHQEGLKATRTRKPRGAAQPRDSADKVRMIYQGRQSSPFSLRGNKSKTMYYRIYPAKPIDVFIVDVPFFEKQGFVRG